MHRQLAGSLHAARFFRTILLLACAAMTFLAVTAVAGAHNAKKGREAGRDFSAPTAARLAGATDNHKITLSWSRSTDNHAVRGYRVYRNWKLVARVHAPTRSFTDGRLKNGARYLYIVKAYDRHGNLSPSSNVVAAKPLVGGGSSAGSPSISASPSPSPDPNPAAPAPTPGSGADVSTAPDGPAGSWELKFDDEFNETSLDASKWSDSWFNGGSMNNTSTSPSNVSVGGGAASLQLSSSSVGALIHTNGDTQAGRASLPVGGVAEARVWFPGSGSQVYNWPAFWANSTASWPAAGEHDIAEGLGGQLTVNYHSPSGSHNQGGPDGNWTNGWHTYTLHRKPDSADVYWDGKLVKSYSTDDSGNPEDIAFNVGSGPAPTMTGAEGALKIDWVRIWQ
jgi:hypothetical protein